MILPERHRGGRKDVSVHHAVTRLIRDQVYLARLTLFKTLGSQEAVIPSPGHQIH